MYKSNRGSKSGGVLNWFLQRVSGIFILFAILIHFWVLHFFPPDHGVITYESVMIRLGNPFWKAFDLLFLVTAIYHGLSGINIVFTDYIRHNGLRISLTGLIWSAALYLLILGSMTILNLS